MQNRRQVLNIGLSMAAAGFAGAAALTGARRSLAAEPPPETTSLRLLSFKNDVTCIAPVDILDDLLRDEGFANVRYVIPADSDNSTPTEHVGRGDADFGQEFSAVTTFFIDAGVPAVMLAGVHTGCFELFARESVRGVADLKGKTLGVYDPTASGSSENLMLKIIAASVGLDPAKDINWVAFSGDPKRLLTDDKIDGFMTFTPFSQEVRALGTGHVILNSAVDRPWSQYFCCMLIGNSDFVRRNPIATKRVVRAMMRATDICVAKPDWVAQQLVDRGFTPRYDYARQGLDEMSYRVWREYDAEDSVRFYALRERELGMIKSSPDAIIAKGADWRFLKEVRKELGI
jgi:NitT/TauT family transport system substrate-binding protein